MAYDRTYTSPNHGPRYLPISAIVLHSGDGTKASDLDWLCQSESGVSSHYYVDRTGRTYQLVNEDRVAWHSGTSAWRGRTNLNGFAIGIEMEHTNAVHHDYTAAQLIALRTLCLELIARHAIKREWIVAHRWIAPTRRDDPRNWSDTDLQRWIESLSTPDMQPHDGYRRYRVNTDGARIRDLPTAEPRRKTIVMATYSTGAIVRGIVVQGDAFRGDRRWVYLDITGYIHRSLLDEIS